MTFYCGKCKKECGWQELDYGFGVTEYWGAVSNHVCIERVSDCCEGDLYLDSELEQHYEYQPD